MYSLQHLLPFFFSWSLRILCSIRRHSRLQNSQTKSIAEILFATKHLLQLSRHSHRSCWYDIKLFTRVKIQPIEFHCLIETSVKLNVIHLNSCTKVIQWCVISLGFISTQKKLLNKDWDDSRFNWQLYCFRSLERTENTTHIYSDDTATRLARGLLLNILPIHRRALSTNETLPWIPWAIHWREKKIAKFGFHDNNTAVVHWRHIGFHFTPFWSGL